jgi:heavy metal sensor kinase
VDAELQHRLSVFVGILRARPPSASPAPASEPPQFDENRINKLVAASALKDQFGAGSDYYFVVWMRGAAPVARSTNAPADVPRPQAGDSATRMRAPDLREAFIFAAPVDCLLVGRSLAGVETGVMLHALRLSAAGGILLAVGLAVGWWLTSRVLRPIHAISETAKQIADGDLSRRINVSQSESELEELAGVLNSTFSRLDSAFAQQARFTSDAAHELRTPLTVLLTQTQAALARERSAEDYKQALRACEGAAKRMRRLMESLLELARFDAGQESLRPVPCDLSAVAGDCAELMRPLAEARGIGIKLDSRRAECAADPDRIAQVVTNLVKNAIDYNREHGSITISTRIEGANAIVEVSDTGVGIPGEHLPHIFERFYRVDAARSDSGARNGLGLAISKAIVDAHRGAISARNNEEGGATFRISIPVRQA